MSRFRRYRNLALVGWSPPPADADVKSVERVLGAKLPPSYLEFLSVGNGAVCSGTIELEDSGGRRERVAFSEFFELGPGKDSRLLREYRQLRRFMRSPREVLPIAQDGMGSVLFLDLTDEGTGRVVAFVDALPEWAGGRASGLLVAASSFEDYLSRLEVPREEIVDSVREAKDPAHLEEVLEWVEIVLPGWKADPDVESALELARLRWSLS